MKLSSDKNYIFESALKQLVFYIHVMNVTLLFIHVINHMNWSVTVLWKIWIRFLTEFDLIEAYFVNTDAFVLALQTNKFSSKRTLYLSISAEKFSFFNTNSTRVKTIILNRITVYKKQTVVNHFQHLTEQFS